MRERFRVPTIVVVFALLPALVLAQARQPLSIQASGAVLFPSTEDPTFSSKTRLGFEAQLRYTFSRFSLGAGYQRSTVFSADNLNFTQALSLVFIEPRYVVAAGNTVALYIAGRAGFGDFVCSEACTAPTSKITLGGGGGLLFRVVEGVSIDLGGQWFTVDDQNSSSFGMVRLGLGIGF